MQTDLKRDTLAEREAQEVLERAWVGEAERPLIDRLSSYLAVDVKRLHVRRIVGAHHFYRIGRRGGLLGAVDRLPLPFRSAFRKWQVPKHLDYDPDRNVTRIKYAGPLARPVIVPEAAVHLAHKVREIPEVKETAIFTEAVDPILAVRDEQGEWYELYRWG
jgi:hypothetical protein